MLQVRIVQKNFSICYQSYLEIVEVEDVVGNKKVLRPDSTSIFRVGV